MLSEKTIRPIATIHNDFKEKFGIPRQSGIVEAYSTIVFEKEYQDINSLRGLEGFSHIWLIWGFSKSEITVFKPTVRPPRLGGNVHIGVFATRSPFRPNGLGLSSVELVKIESQTKDGPVLIVKGADLMDSTPIYDIKPYLKQFDSHPLATTGFSSENQNHYLKIDFPENILSAIPISLQKPLLQLLAQDPRPQYHKDNEKQYGLTYGNFNVLFYVKNKTLYVTDVLPTKA
ncbi:MAG: tRNA (N6-threonylcarbamoyladenosine(37)-N6)-methyltransferase TrmO [Sphaerochaetaceae bacterium]|nr:tRNA (N6-threonylcarbamoyladenosine(37)-N6)-methyltransferase TrmO [Sphaerochaetaceae bacterium]